MKKVALVFDGLGFGGIERVGVDYAKLFHNIGYDVSIYNLRPDLKDMEANFPQKCHMYHKKMPYLLLPDVYYLGVKRWWWGKYAYPFAYAVSKICMYLFRFLHGRREKYNIVVAFSGHFRDLTFVAGNFLRSGKKMCWLHGGLRDYIVSSVSYGNLYKKIKNLCVLSEDGQDITLRENPYWYPLNIHHIYNPIPTEKGYIDERLVEDLRKKYGEFLLQVARFEKDKDQKNAISALKILHEKYQKKVYLVFVGDGSTLEDCRSHAKKLGLERFVIFMGARHDVQNFYTAAALHLHSSPAEGLPTVLLEAMKYEIPNVATNSMPGVTEILKNDLYGLRCEVADPEDMALKVNEMLEDKDKQAYYISQGKKRLASFSYETIEKQLYEITNTLL